MAIASQNNLEISLAEAVEDPSARPQFYADFMESNVLVINEGVPPPSSSTGILPAGYSLKLRHINWNGLSYIPIFSSAARLSAVIDREVNYLELSALELMRITQGANLVLNPGSDLGKEFPKEEIAAMLDGSLFQPAESYVAEKEARVMIGQPSNYPHALVNALSKLFAKTPEVKKAYVAHFFNPVRDQVAHTLVAIEVEHEWDKILSSAGMVISQVSCPDPPVDIIQITGRGGLEDYFLQESKPFYERA